MESFPQCCHASSVTATQLQMTEERLGRENLVEGRNRYQEEGMTVHPCCCHFWLRHEPRYPKRERSVLSADKIWKFLVSEVGKQLSLWPTLFLLSPLIYDITVRPSVSPPPPPPRTPAASCAPRCNSGTHHLHQTEQKSSELRCTWNALFTVTSRRCCIMHVTWDNPRRNEPCAHASEVLSQCAPANHHFARFILNMWTFPLPLMLLYIRTASPGRHFSSRWHKCHTGSLSVAGFSPSLEWLKSQVPLQNSQIWALTAMSCDKNRTQTHTS
jgi:hypothetical protein